MGGTELKYVNEAFQQNWIAPLGPNVNGFEEAMVARMGEGRALAVSAGTAAIHLALRYLGVTAEDYVFCSSMTFIGSCAAINYMGATPVFIDSEPNSWNMSPVALEKAFKWASMTGKLPKAVIIVDLYGHPADYDKLLPICEKYNTPVIEDAAEALGAVYHGKPCGTLGAFNVLSFNGNKIITTSGGGMLLTRDKAAREKMLFWATQARDNAPHYEHTEYGYNYRMSNICAGIGRGQMEILDFKLKRRAEIYKKYIELFNDSPYRVKLDAFGAEPNHWLTVASIEGGSLEQVERIVADMNAHDIETRPAWKPLHMQPLYNDAPSFAHNDTNDKNSFICARLFETGLCLPSGDAMTDDQQRQVVSLLKASL